MKPGEARVKNEERMISDDIRNDLVLAVSMLERAGIIDFDGALIEGEDVPPMEFPIHAELYRRRPDVNAVVDAPQFRN